MKHYYLYFTLKITREQQQKTACLETLQLFLQATEHCNNILALLTTIFSPRNGNYVLCCWNSRLLINGLIYSCSRFTGKYSQFNRTVLATHLPPVWWNRTKLAVLLGATPGAPQAGKHEILLSQTEHFRTELRGWSKTDNYIDYWLYTTDISMSYSSVLLVYRKEIKCYQTVMWSHKLFLHCHWG